MTSTAISSLRNGVLRTRDLRIVAMPLAKPRLAPGAPHEAQRILTYYQFETPPRDVPTLDKESVGLRSFSFLPKEGVVPWAQSKAVGLWESFGKAEGGWKLKVFQTGQRLMDKVEFEEIALRGLDPSLGPSLRHPRMGSLARMEKGTLGSDDSPLKISLLYPPSVTTSTAALEQLKRSVGIRTPMHRKGFYRWLAVIPFTLPFTFIPIIPNLPFFFSTWRSWSHYRAYSSSQYLESLLERNAIVPEASEILDSIYKSRQTPNSNSSTQGPFEALLTKADIPALVERLSLQAHASVDLNRALEQVKLRIRDGKLES